MEKVKKVLAIIIILYLSIGMTISGGMMIMAAIAYLFGPDGSTELQYVMLPLLITVIYILLTVSLAFDLMGKIRKFLWLDIALCFIGVIGSGLLLIPLNAVRMWTVGLILFDVLLIMFMTIEKIMAILTNKSK